MNNKTLMWIIIGILFIAVLFLTFKAATTGNASAVQSGVSAAQAAAQSASSGMVGGC